MTESLRDSYYLRQDLNFMDEPAKEALPTQEKPVLISPIHQQPESNQKRTSVDFEPFNPRTVSKEQFDQLQGSVQEFTLKYLIKTSDKESINRLRSDFEMEKPLSNYEIALTDAIEKVTRRENPITERLPNGITDPDIAFIITFAQVPDETGGRGWKTDPELIRKLEDERLRRQGNDEDLFYSWEWIGRYAPARRYRVLLEEQVEKEKEKEKEKERVAQMKNSDSTVIQEVAEIRADPELVDSEKIAA